MKIIKLSAENVKRLNAVAIEPDGSLVRITGRNGQGKTSVLDSITYALGGKGTVCERPVRDGADKATIVLELDDLIVTRTFKPDGTSALSVTTKAGAKHASPQAMLDKLVGSLSFDPLGFARMNPAAQLETLKTLVGLDFSKVDAERKRIFDERTTINRSVKIIEGQIAGMAFYTDAPVDEVSVADLSAELRTANAINQEYKLRESNLADNQRLLAGEMKRVADLEKQLAAAKKYVADQEGSVECSVRSLAEIEPRDTAAVITRIESADAINAKVRSNRAVGAKQMEMASTKAAAEAMTKQLDKIDAEKQTKLEAAKFPVDGLSFTDTGVSYRNIPFSQASAAEQLRVSVAMGLAMNPALRVLLIRDGSLLDADNLALIAEMAEKADAQIWIERVGNAGEIGIVIEDGRVMAAEQESNGKLQ